MDYNFREIEKKWQQQWKETKAYMSSAMILNDPNVMCWICFLIRVAPGLHVGHPLGYISSDIYSRYKRLKGI